MWQAATLTYAGSIPVTDSYALIAQSGQSYGLLIRRPKVRILLGVREVLMNWLVALLFPLLTKYVDERLVESEKRIMGAQQDQVNAISAQLTKARDEIVAKVDELESQVAAGETPDFSELRSVAQALDDVVPDATDPTA